MKGGKVKIIVLRSLHGCAMFLVVGLVGRLDTILLTHARGLVFVTFVEGGAVGV